MRTWLVQLREDKNLSQCQVSLGAEISQNHYSSIETGKRRPSVNVAKRIADILGFDWQRFYEE